MVSHFETFVERDNTPVLQISLVAYKNASDIVLRVLFDLAHPGMDGTEGVTVCDIISYNDTVCTLIVA